MPFRRCEFRKPAESPRIIQPLPATRRNRPPAAVGQRLGAVADHLAAFEQLGDERMLLEFLQHTLRIEARIGIVEPGDEAERDHVVFAAVNPGAAVFLRGQRPAHGVDDFAGRDAAGGDFPQFLDALSVGLRVAVLRSRSKCAMSCLVSDPRVPSARITTLACRS